MLKKPLFRFTLGDVSFDGMCILRTAIKKIKSLYPACDIVICYNSISEKILKYYDDLDVSTIRATTSEVEYDPKNEMWKMYPPRIDIDTHEIVLDNDLIFFSRIKEIDEFFSGEHTLLLRGKARSYGNYDHLVPMDYAFNSGLYGMPPKFDLSKYIKETCKNDIERKWTKWCDDQGVIAHSLTKVKFKIIENNVITNYFPEDEYDLPYDIKGVHLIGSNRCMQKNWKTLIAKHLIHYR